MKEYDENRVESRNIRCQSFGHCSRGTSNVSKQIRFIYQTVLLRIKRRQSFSFHHNKNMKSHLKLQAIE